MEDVLAENPLVDGFGRRHRYLRVAVTDRCNLRCTYCMPAAGLPFKAHRDILSFEEIERVARVLSVMGVDKVRLTGGEPLVRRDVPKLIAALTALPRIERVTMTSNGVLLAQYAHELRQAGLRSINISLDSLQPDRFDRITRRDQFAQVWAGVEAALAEGFMPVKLNVVVMRGFNDDELLDFAELARDWPLHIRFIEYMPFDGNQWSADRLVSYEEMKRTIERRLALLPILPEDPDQPARDFAIPGFAGRVGIIASMTRPFCSRCSRLRLTADGALKTCLFHYGEHRLREVLRNGMQDSDLAREIRNALLEKPYGHAPMNQLQQLPNRKMSEIGG